MTLFFHKESEDDEQSSSSALALKVSCGKCGNPLGHEFVGDGPDGKSRFVSIYLIQFLDYKVFFN